MPLYKLTGCRPGCHNPEGTAPAGTPMGTACICWTCEQTGAIAPAMPRAIGVMVEQRSDQLGVTFTSNRQREEYLRVNNLHAVSDAEAKRHEDNGWQAMEDNARAVGLTLEQAAKKEVEAIKEKRSSEIAAGLTPTVKEQRVQDMLPP